MFRSTSLKFVDPDIDAAIVADNIARQLEGKIAYRRAVKGAIGAAMRGGARRDQVQISGRLNGAEIARSRCTRKAVRLCTRFVQISTTLRLKL